MIFSRVNERIFTSEKINNKEKISGEKIVKYCIIQENKSIKERKITGKFLG